MARQQHSTFLLHIVTRFGFLIGAAILILFALATLGALLPALAYVGATGSLLLGLFAPWFVIGSFLAAMLCLWRWRAHRSREMAVMSVVALFALIGSTTIFARMVGAAEASGVDINVRQTLTRSFIDDGSAPDARETYETFEGQPQNVGIYRATRRGAANALAPTLLYVHGGGWVSGHAGNRANDLRWFAGQGWLVLTIDYALATPARPMWDKMTPQIGCAMAWAAANAQRWGGDPARLTMTGESAGGNLVINAAYQANTGTLKSSCGGTVPKVRAISAVYPVVDPANMATNPDPLNGKAGRKMVETYVGGAPRTFPERYAAINSNTHISAAAPPTLIIVGESDHLVPPEPAYDFARRTAAAGIKTKLIRIPYADHAFDFAKGNVGNQLYRQATHKFLFEQAAK